MNKAEVTAYIAFMNDKKNIRKCDRCPANIGMTPDAGDRNPCGQYRCWVSIHCSRQ